MELKDIKYKNIIIKPRGKVIFRHCSYNEKKYEAEVLNYDDDRASMSEYSVIGDLFTGDDFLACARCGGIMDYDGCLGNVYINGYETNLGLSCNGLHQGYFQVDESTWEDICDEYDVMVEWCNK